MSDGIRVEESPWYVLRSGKRIEYDSPRVSRIPRSSARDTVDPSRNMDKTIQKRYKDDTRTGTITT